MDNRLTNPDSLTSSGTNMTASTFDAADRLLSTTGTGASTYSNDANSNTLTDTGGPTMT